MKILQILEEFIKECTHNLSLKSIIQFGSSTYYKNFEDIDIIFIFNDNVIKTSNILKLRDIIKKFEEVHKEIVFDFGGVGTRKRKAQYSITIVLLSLQDLNTKYTPQDLFLLKTLKLDKNLKVLYGVNPFTNSNTKLTKQHLFEMLSIELKHTLRKNLDGEIDKESVYRLFKTFLRAMLIEYGFFEKKELLDEFNKKFGEKVKLPKNSKDIMLKTIRNEDFKDILNFAENCLKYLLEK